MIKPNKIYLKKILLIAHSYLKKASLCQQKEIVNANKFAGAYCQPHIVRQRISDIVQKILARPQLRANQPSNRVKFSNMLESEINQKHYQANLIKDVIADENNEKIYANYCLGLLRAATILGFKSSTHLFTDINHHVYKTALLDLAKDAGLLFNKPESNSKIIHFPVQFRH